MDHSGILAESLQKVLGVQVPLVRGLTHRQMWVDFQGHGKNPVLSSLRSLSKMPSHDRFSKYALKEHFLPLRLEKTHLPIYKRKILYKLYSRERRQGLCLSYPLSSTRLCMFSSTNSNSSR